MTHLQRAADALYPATGTRQAGNVKFFRGLSREVTAEQLSEQLERHQRKLLLAKLHASTISMLTCLHKV